MRYCATCLSLPRYSATRHHFQKRMKCTQAMRMFCVKGLDVERIYNINTLAVEGQVNLAIYHVNLLRCPLVCANPRSFYTVAFDTIPTTEFFWIIT